MKELLDMLTYRRPADSDSEKEWIAKFIDTVPGMNTDGFGNRYITVGETEPTTLFSAHTDTVHRQSGRQKVIVDPIAKVAYKNDNTPLGADDATGCWILKNLIAAKIPGLYIFHRKEEVGGQGSAYIADKTPTLLKGIKRAIAFDRKKNHSVITHQRGRCCSDTFAIALANQLHYALDATGLFTDTANYVAEIQECTNLSVGYNREHTGQEYQDLRHALVLLKKLKKVKWDTLPTERSLSTSRFKRPRYGAWADNDDYMGFGNSFMGYNNRRATITPAIVSSALDEHARYADIVSLVYNFPAVAIELLSKRKTTYKQIADADKSRNLGRIKPRNLNYD